MKAVKAVKAVSSNSNATMFKIIFGAVVLLSIAQIIAPIVFRVI